MPQLNKGGKFIFGKSVIQRDLQLQFPLQAISEYDICSEGKIYLFTGAKATGGFCVTRKGLLLPSKLGHILMENPALCNFSFPEGKFLPYKGRSYCWISVSSTGKIQFTESILQTLNLSAESVLLSIRSSNIAFTMGAKGPLWERAQNYTGTIEVF